MQPQEPAAVVEADRPHGRQFEARDLLEQRRLDQLLETLHLQTDRRLRPAEVFRRAGEAARLHDRDKGPDDVDRDAAGGHAFESPEATESLGLIHGSPPFHKRVQYDHSMISIAEVAPRKPADLIGP